MGCPKLNYFDILKCASLKAPRGQRQHTSKNKKHICLSAKKKTSSFCSSLHIYAQGSFDTWQTGYYCQGNLLMLSFSLTYGKINFLSNLWEAKKVLEFMSSKQIKTHLILRNQQPSTRI